MIGVAVGDDQQVDSRTSTSREKTANLPDGRMTVPSASVHQSDLSVGEIDQRRVALAYVDERHAKQIPGLLPRDQCTVCTKPQECRRGEDGDALPPPSGDQQEQASHEHDEALRDVEGWQPPGDREGSKRVAKGQQNLGGDGQRGTRRFGRCGNQRR